MNRGLVLLSGGLDSAVASWIADGECGKLYAMTFRYGQAHSKEVDCALRLGMWLSVERHRILDLPLNEIGGSALFDKDEIPTNGLREGVAPTWVPQRNSIFLAFAFAWAEVLGCKVVYIGVNQLDYSGYPDCREDFILRIAEALNLASKKFVEGGRYIEIKTPLLNKSKAEIVRLGGQLGVPFELTWSCYLGEEEACGKCDSCLIRIKAFEGAGVVDPLKYKEV